MKNVLVGHRRQIQQLEQALEENRVHHALLFSGIEGIGKKKAALEFAKRLIRNGAEKIGRTVHPDFFPVGPGETGTIKIEAIRALKQAVTLKPAEGEAKVVLIEPAEAMTETAANALLKILEEPPPRTHFILVTSRPLRLLPTIRSRCQQIAFTPLNREEIGKILEEAGVPAEERETRIAFANGSAGAALSLDLAFLKELRAILKSLEENPNAGAILKQAETWGKKGEEEEEKIPSLLGHLSLLWHQKIVSELSAERRERLLDQWQTLQETHGGLERNVNKQLLLENLLFRLLHA